MTAPLARVGDTIPRNAANVPANVAQFVDQRYLRVWSKHPANPAGTWGCPNPSVAWGEDHLLAECGPLTVTAVHEPRSDAPAVEVIERLAMAAMNLRSARRRITGDYVNPDRLLDPLSPLDGALEEIDRARSLLTGARMLAANPINDENGDAR